MAINPVQNYLNDVARYYQLNQAAQQQGNPQQQPAFAGGFAAPAVNLMPGLGFGGNLGGGGGPGINVIGGVDVLDRARENQREDREESRATSAAWIGAILTIIGSAGLACIMSKWNESSERLEAARQFKDEQIPLVGDAEKAQLTQIVNKDIRILEKKVSQARNIVILSGIALATAVTAFVAGMLSIQWLITAAIVVGVATLAIGAFAAVYYYMQKSESPEGVLEYLRAHHPAYV